MKRITGVIGIFAVPISFALSQISAGAATTVTPTGQDVNTAVEKGVAYLDTKQNANGSWGTSFPIAETSLALISYGVSDRGDVNSLSTARQATVKKAVGWLLGKQDTTATHTQTVGTWGATEDDLFTYDTGLAVSALSFSKNADTNLVLSNAIMAGRAALVRLFQGPTHDPTEACSSEDNGTGSDYCGGFNYDFGTRRSDESNTGFGLTGLQLSGGVPAALQALDKGWQRHVQEIAANPFHTQTDGGGSYQPGTTYPPFRSNANDTGSLLFGYGFDGVPSTDAGVQAALTFGQHVLDVYELDKAKGADALRTMVYHSGSGNAVCTQDSTDCGWQSAGDGGYHYSLWALSKGLGEYISPDLTQASNWYHKIADLLVSQQETDGSWPKDGRDDASVIGATGFAIFALGLAATPPPPVTNFSAAPFAVNGQCTGVHLSWTNPNSPNYGGVEIRRRTDQSPSSHSDGTLVTKANRPATKFDDKGLTANKTYFYGAFSYDTTGQLFGPEATATASTATCVLAPTGQPRSSPNYLGPGLLLFVLGLAVAFGRERRLRLG